MVYSESSIPHGVHEAGAALGPGGPLSRHIAGFTPRRHQEKMAGEVAEALAGSETLITEAGTGTGKTFAYLVPSLMSGRRVIISTGTKNLQDQLFHRDLPTVQAALGTSARAALLKGRINYLCLYRFGRHKDSRRAFESRQSLSDLHQIETWATRTRTGDVAELEGIPENSPLWPHITSTPDNCLGQTCPDHAECFLVKARREAQMADIVVVNHHLLFADLALKEEGFGDVLPGADAFIVDEAHQVPDVAAQFYGLSLGSRQLLDLARDTLTEALREAPDMPALRTAAEALEKTARDLVLALSGPPRRVAWAEAFKAPQAAEGVSAVGEALERLHMQLEAGAARGKGLENCWRRCADLIQRLVQLSQGQSGEAVHWVETNKTSFRLCLTPLDIARNVRAQMEQFQASWVFTSATLAVGDDFNHFTNRLGIEHGATRRWDSPFDFERNALLYLPEGLPLPEDGGYTDAVVAAAVPVIEASRGRAFFLFTSHRALGRAARLLDGVLDYPLLVQGSAAKSRLLEEFRTRGNAVLLGTQSFWEGVDVRGPALSCVIIDRLPFTSPDDPVMQARLQALRERGENPFVGYQLPNAVITLKQGIGRLIRDDQDKGLLMLCDPRLLSRPYGKVFLNSLPVMPRTRSLNEAVGYLATLPTVGD